MWVLWLTYGSFYFCRTNISVALGGIEADPALGYSKTQMAMVLGALKIAYAVGQLLNGQLAERFSARRLLAIGMLCSAGLNVVFGLSTGLYFLLFVWATNGYVQALGWTPCMRVAADWIPAERRGRQIGLIGTGYQAIGALTFVVAGYSAREFGWRFAFYVPALLLTASCVHMLFFLRDRPPEGPRRAREARRMEGRGAGERMPVLATVLATLANPALWCLGVSLGLLNACRYGFLDWGIKHLLEVQGTDVGENALKYAVLPLGGIVGSCVSGWATDRFFGGRRAPITALLLVLLGILTILYSRVVHVSVALTVVTLVLVGFCIYGPQVLLVGTAPVDLARRGTPAAAVGFVDFMGYVGAFSGDMVTGVLADRDSSWRQPLLFWASCAFGAAIAAALLWNAMSAHRRGRVGMGGDPESEGGNSV